MLVPSPSPSLYRWSKNIDHFSIERASIFTHWTEIICWKCANHLASTKQILFEMPIFCSQISSSFQRLFGRTFVWNAIENFFSLCFLAQIFRWRIDTDEQLTYEHWQGCHRYMFSRWFFTLYVCVCNGQRGREKNNIIIQQYAFQLVIFINHNLPCAIATFCSTVLHYASTSSKWLIFQNLLQHISLLLQCRTDQLAHSQIKQTWRIPLFSAHYIFGHATVAAAAAGAFHPVKH